MMPSQQLLGRGDSRLGSAESLVGGSHVPGQVAKLEPGSESYTGPHTQASHPGLTGHSNLPLSNKCILGVKRTLRKVICFLFELATWSLHFQ